MLVLITCPFLWRKQLEKDTRSDTELEETDSEDEKVVDKQVSNNSSSANGERKTQQVNAVKTSSSNKKTQ